MYLYLKRLLKSIFGIELLGVFNRWRLYRKYYKSGRFSRGNIDHKLESLLPHTNGFYVELGANDGALASNSFFFEIKKNWRGVLIEPAPNLYLSCKKRRGKNNIIFCNACVSFDYKHEFVRMKYSDAMTISDNLKLDIGNHDSFITEAEKHLLEGESNFVFGAKSATLNSLLLKSSAPNLIDFLSLDVEGAELEVLKGLDFTKFQFKYMVIESRSINLLENFLNKHSYKLIEKLNKRDYIFALNIKSYN
jgi:FkbM family methyltransferase